jgi:hypothetical protein
MCHKRRSRSVRDRSGLPLIAAVGERHCIVRRRARTDPTPASEHRDSLGLCDRAQHLDLHRGVECPPRLPQLQLARLPRGRRRAGPAGGFPRPLSPDFRAHDPDAEDDLALLGAYRGRLQPPSRKRATPLGLGGQSAETTQAVPPPRLDPVSRDAATQRSLRRAHENHLRSCNEFRKGA